MQAQNKGAVDLSATGGITTTAGTIVAGLLRSAAGSQAPVLIDGIANQIAEVGNFVITGGAFTLLDTISVLASGTVRSDSAITITGSAGTISVTGTLSAPRTVLTSLKGGIGISGALAGLGSSGINPNQSVATVNQFPAATGLGAFLTAATGINMNAPASVTGGAGTAFPDLTLVSNTAGPVVFGGAGGVFDAPTASLWIKLLDRGAMSGSLNVKGLHAFYDPAIQEQVSLSGSINGLGGSSAASAAFILPQARSNYLFNGCPIQSVNCIQITTLSVPVTNPARDVQFGRIQPPSDVQNLLPDVADRDYPGDEQ